MLPVGVASSMIGDSVAENYYAGDPFFVYCSPRVDLRLMLSLFSVIASFVRPFASRD